MGLISLTLVVPAVAQGAPAQLGARDEPTIDGPVTPKGSQCKDTAQRFEGRVVAKGSVCLYIFAFEPAAETEPELDYGVLWAQSTVWTAKGWCTSKVSTDIVVPPEVGIGTMEPQPASIPERTQTTVALETDAGGNSLETANVSANLILYAGELTRPAQAAPESGETPPQRIRLTWSGLESRKVAFASGAEVSWTATDGLPAVSYRVRYPVTTSC